MKNSFGTTVISDDLRRYYAMKASREYMLMFFGSWGCIKGSWNRDERITSIQ